jgi:DNA replication and repair protein RecF
MVVGPNGAGKTNLLESVHVGTQGVSLRTRRDVRVVRFGTDAARVRVSGAQNTSRPFAVDVTISASGGRAITADGASVDSAERLRRRFPVLAFTPDRLAVVKGGPLVRRTYLDRTLTRLFPARADLPSAYAQALSQRNAALRRARAGASSVEAISPWTAALARLGDELDEARRDVVLDLSPRFEVRAAELGLGTAAISYGGNGLSVRDLEERLDRDLERGTTGAGPHLEDLEIRASARELRFFGSQGEQRTAVLALLLAEAESLASTRGEGPLLLLDDVLSELDGRRRAALVDALPGEGQALLSATSAESLPAGARPPAAVIDVTPGIARRR